MKSPRTVLKPQFAFISPTLVFLLLVVAFPLVYVLYMSTQEWYLASRVPPTFVGLKNYAEIIFKDSRFGSALKNTFLFTLIALTLQTTLGVLCALLFDTEFKGRGIVRTVFIVPMATTPVAISLVWILMMQPTTGVLNYFLSLVHIKPALWVFSQKTVLLALAIVDTWMWTPFIMLITLGGLSSLPTEPFEQAKIDGANSFQTFFRITLPLLRPYIAVAVILRSIDCLKTFDIIFVMTQGGPGTASETLNIFMFLKGFYQFHIGYASAVAVVFFVIILVVSIVLLRFRRPE